MQVCNSCNHTLTHHEQPTGPCKHDDCPCTHFTSKRFDGSIGRRPNKQTRKALREQERIAIHQEAQRIATARRQQLRAITTVPEAITQQDDDNFLQALAQYQADATLEGDEHTLFQKSCEEGEKTETPREGSPPSRSQVTLDAAALADALAGLSEPRHSHADRRNARTHTREEGGSLPAVTVGAVSGSVEESVPLTGAEPREDERYLLAYHRATAHAVQAVTRRDRRGFACEVLTLCGKRRFLQAAYTAGARDRVSGVTGARKLCAACERIALHPLTVRRASLVRVPSSVVA